MYRKIVFRNNSPKVQPIPLPNDFARLLVWYTVIIIVTIKTMFVIMLLFIVVSVEAMIVTRYSQGDVFDIL